MTGITITETNGQITIEPHANTTLTEAIGLTDFAQLWIQMQLAAQLERASTLSPSEPVGDPSAAGGA